MINSKIQDRINAQIAKKKAAARRIEIITISVNFAVLGISYLLPNTAECLAYYYTSCVLYRVCTSNILKELIQKGAEKLFPYIKNK